MSTGKWALHFANHGHKSFLITRSRSPLIQEMANQPVGLCVVRGKDYLAPQASWQIRQFIKANSITAIYLHSLRDLWILRPALTCMPQVQVFGFARMFLRGINKKDFMHRFMYRRMERLLAHSHAQLEHLLKCLPIEAEKCQVIPNGVDLSKFQPGTASSDVRASLGVTDSNQKLIGLIGRLDRQKGQIELAEAARALRLRFPDARYVFVGGATRGEPSIREQLERIIQESKLGEVIQFTEFRKDVAAVMRALDILVMPSYEESFGNVLIEAMACKRVCLGTRAGGVPEIIEHHKTGVLVEPQNSQSLAEGIAYLLDHEEHAQKMIATAYEKVLRQYDIERVFAQVASFLGR